MNIDNSNFLSSKHYFDAIKYKVSKETLLCQWLRKYEI